jgi:hypothetical protein
MLAVGEAVQLLQEADRLRFSRPPLVRDPLAGLPRGSRDTASTRPHIDAQPVDVVSLEQNSAFDSGKLRTSLRP